MLIICKLVNFNAAIEVKTFEIDKKKMHFNYVNIA